MQKKKYRSRPTSTVSALSLYDFDTQISQKITSIAAIAFVSAPNREKQMRLIKLRIVCLFILILIGGSLSLYRCVTLCVTNKLKLNYVCTLYCMCFL